MINDHSDAVAEQWGLRLESAYRQHRERITAILRGRFPMPAIEDALQEVFIQLLRREPSSRAAVEVTLNCAYLFQCVRRRLVRVVTTEQRHRESTLRAYQRSACADGVRLGTDSDPVHRAEPTFTEADLERAFERLPSVHCEVLRSLCAENVLPNERSDAGRALAGRDRVRKHRALAALRDALTHERCVTHAQSAE